MSNAQRYIARMEEGDRVRKLEAERDRLREALKYALDDLEWGAQHSVGGNEFDEGIRQARAALQGAQDE